MNPMPLDDRRTMLRKSLALAAVPGTALLYPGCGRADEQTEPSAANSSTKPASDSAGKGTSNEENAMKVQYLEIVTPDVEAVCATYSKLLDATFGGADPNLGGARTAKLAGGGMLGVRGPLRETEEPVVRPYVLVDDIESALAAAEKSGAKIALPPMKLAGHGTCAIYILGGIEFGLWEL